MNNDGLHEIPYRWTNGIWPMSYLRLRSRC